MSMALKYSNHLDVAGSQMLLLSQSCCMLSKDVIGHLDFTTSRHRRLMPDDFAGRDGAFEGPYEGDSEANPRKES
jgi:hypothetical protein